MNKYKQAIMREIKNAEKKIESDYLKTYANKNNIERLEIVTKGYKYGDQVFDIFLDDYKLSNVMLDNYNNLSVGKFSSIMSIEYLNKFIKFFNDILENIDSYHHRAGRGFLIDYLRKFYKIITPEFLEDMCKLDDEDGEKNSTFRDWVYGSSLDWQIADKFGIKRL